MALGSRELAPEEGDAFKRICNKFTVGDGCWEWTGGKSVGYGIFFYKGRTTTGHRALYQMLYGDLPDELHLDHLCRNPGCVNPAHLEPVSCRENIMRGTGITAVNNARTHCKWGHPLSGDNLRHNTNGSRRCRACRNRRERERNERLRTTHKEILT